MSRRLIVSGGSRPIELQMVGTLIVGRDPVCEISEQTDPLLSRRHAAFTADARDVMVRDLGSRNGILVNGVKMPESKLRDGDVVQIGHLQVRYVDEIGPFRDLPSADNAATKLLDMSAEASAKADPNNTVPLSSMDVTKKLT